MFGRVEQELDEERGLSHRAAWANRSQGRRCPEELCSMRTEFQRDRDRIIHSKAFRRLKHKTQVFIAPDGDHYRTRLTHTLEVSQIARTMARLLRLNEDLTEAIALGHDLGHTPFGHAGEGALNRLMPGGFTHYEQSLRVVDLLESGKKVGYGLNLTAEVRNGILGHTGPEKPWTLEGQLVRWADRIAYLNHDIDDAVRGKILDPEDLPTDLIRVLGDNGSKRITRMIQGIVFYSEERDEIAMEPVLREATDALREFLFGHVYIGSRAKTEENKVYTMMEQLYHYYIDHPGDLPEPIQDGFTLERRVGDYLAGMTDSFCLDDFQHRFMPKGWKSGD